MADEKPHTQAVDGTGKRFAIVAARFNQSVVDPMLESAMATLKRHGVRDADIEVLRAPGAFELPLLAKALIAGEDYLPHAVIALGAVIRGETPHFDFVAGECAAGLRRVALETGVPMIFGVLTTNTDEQALARANPQRGDKGGDAALAALEMAAALEAADGLLRDRRARYQRGLNAALAPR